MVEGKEIVTRIRSVCRQIEKGEYGHVGERGAAIARDILVILGEELPTDGDTRTAYYTRPARKKK